MGEEKELARAEDSMSLSKPPGYCNIIWPDDPLYRKLGEVCECSCGALGIGKPVERMRAMKRESEDGRKFVGKVALDSEWGSDNSMHFCLNGHKRRQEMHPDEPLSNSAPVQKHVAEEVVVKQVEERLKENHAGTCTDGDSGEDCVSITLIWDQAGGAWDLDLWVTDPSGEVIKHDHKTSASGGKLDTDKIESDDDPVENIIWKRDAPKGEYVVQVHPFAAGGKGKNFKVVIMHHGEQEILQEMMEVDESRHWHPAKDVKRFTN